MAADIFLAVLLIMNNFGKHRERVAGVNRFNAGFLPPQGHGGLLESQLQEPLEKPDSV